MSKTIVFLGNFDEVFSFETKTLNYLFGLEDCFRQIKKSIFQIEGSCSTFQTKNYNFDQIAQNEESIKSANIIVLILSYTDSEPFDFQEQEWVNDLKNCISDHQYGFLIGNTSTSFNTNSISEQIINLMNILKINKFFEKRSDKFLTEGQKMGSLTILPDFFQYFANQLKLISNLPLNIPENQKIKYSEGKFTYILFPYSKTATIIEYSKETGEAKIEIPSYVNYDSENYYITEIGINAFKKSEIESLEFMPDSHIKKICKLAFQESSITSLSIPDSLEILEEDWCKYVEHLNTININENHPHFHYKNGILYDKDCHEIIFAVRNYSGSLEIPKDTLIKKICASAFYSCTQIKSFIIMSSTFELIEPFAFCQCDHLESIHISGTDKVTLGKNSFAMAILLTNIAISCNELIIDDSCFQKCDSISSLSLPFTKISVGSLSFFGCHKLNAFSVPKATSVEIKDHGFSCLNKLDSIILKTEHYSFSIESFDNCSSVSSIYFNTFDDINSNLLKNFSSLRVLNLSSLSTLTITRSSLTDKKDIKELILRSRNLILEEGCFKNLENLSNIEMICENKINFASDAFENCKSLKVFKYISQKGFKVSEKIKLAENCFSNSENLEEVELTANRIKLHNNCFNGLKKLHKIVLRSKSIFADDNCFSNCSSLKSFKIIESQEIGDTNTIDLSDNCFLNTINLEEVELTANNIKLGRSCFHGSKSLQKVILHCMNADIAESCFNGLTSLKSFKISEYRNNNNINKVILSEKSFFNVNKLKEFDIKAKKISIGYQCFYGASSLQDVFLNCENVSVSDNSFNFCDSLKTFKVYESRSASIGKKQFIKCPNLNEINIIMSKNNLNLYDEDCLFLEKNSFTGANNLQIVEFVGGNIHIPNELLNFASIKNLKIKSANDVEIDSKAFNNCKELLSIDIDSKSLKVNDNCFNNNSKLEKIIFNCYNIHIQSKCFNKNGKCDNLIFNDAIFVYMDSNDFCYMNSLTKIEFKSFAYFIIGQNCFNKLNKLETIEFYSQKVTFGSGTFQHCSSLKSVKSTYLNINLPLSIAKSLSINNSSNLYKIEEIFIGDDAFYWCNNLEELNIESTNEILIGKKCFLKNKNLGTITINCPRSYIDEKSFNDCPGKKSISQRLFEKHKNNGEKLNIKPIYLKFMNDKKFDSFYFLGIDRYTLDPSFISMFPSRPVSFPADITSILSFCYPHGKISVPLDILRDDNPNSYVVDGFIFNICNQLSENGYIGVVIRFCIPDSANSLVGAQYDRSYAFCLCLITSNPDIASHFSFLYSLIDPIIGKTTLQPEPYIVPDNLKNQTEKCVRYLHIKPNNEYIALSPSVHSMASFLPKLMNYYTSSPKLRMNQYKYLLYPTLQTLLTFVSPSQLVELALAKVCEFKIIFKSKNVNKASFCVAALTNLLEDLDVFLFKYLYIPSVLSDILEMPFPFIAGYHEERNSADIIVDLETGQITYNEEKISIIRQFPYTQKLISKVEELLNNNLHTMEIPNKNQVNEYTQFIQNANEAIYPQCFQYFAQSKYILTESLILKLVSLLTNPLFSYLKNFANKSINTDESDPNNPVANFDRKSFMNRIGEIHKEFISAFGLTETFNQLGMKLEGEKVDKIKFEQKKKHINTITQKSLKHKRSNSLPMKNNLPKLD